MKLTEDQKRTVERMRNNRHFDLPPNLSDEEVLAQARFVDFGTGKVYRKGEEVPKTDPLMEHLKVHDPERYEEWRTRPCYKGTIYEKDTDEIEEV